MSIEQLKKHGITLNKLKKQIDKSIQEKKYYTKSSSKNSVFLPLTFDGSEFVLEQKFVAKKKESLEDVLKKILTNISSERKTKKSQDSLDIITQAFTPVIEDQKTFQLFETSLQPAVGDLIVFDNIVLAETNPQLRSLYTVLIKGRDVIPMEDIGKVRGHVRSDSVESLLIGTEGEVLSDSESGDANLPIASVADHITSLKKYFIDYSEQAGIPFLTENTIYDDLNSIDKTCVFINKTSPILNQPGDSGFGIVFNYVVPDLNIIFQIFAQISNDPSFRKIYYREKFTDWGGWIEIATLDELNPIFTDINVSIQELTQNQTTLQTQLNTVTTDLNTVKTVCTNYTDQVFVTENTKNNEVLISNNVFTETSNVCKIPSQNGNTLEKWICYSNEADGYKLYIKNIADINGSGTKITNIGGKNPRMYNGNELLYIPVEGTYKDRIMKKNAFVLSDGLAWGSNLIKAYNFCVAHGNQIVISLISQATNLDQRLHLLRTDGNLIQLTTAKVSKVDYKHGYLFFINQDQNYKLYKKSINDGTLGAILISQDVTGCTNLFNTIDNLLIYEAGGFVYSKRDIDVSDGAPICIPPSASIDYKIGCDLGGGEAIIFKETASEGEFLMYRKKMFVHI